MACLRHQSKSEVLGVLASLSNLTLLIFLRRIRGTAFLIGGFLLEHVIDNCGECMGRGRRRFRRPQFAAHAAREGPEITRAIPQTLRRHTQGATGPIVDPPTARGEHFAATHAVVWAEPQPGRTMLVRRPFMHIEADCGEDGMDRQGL